MQEGDGCAVLTRRDAGMAAEEDKKFDAVLGGFLADDLRGRAGRLHCPDLDVLAAYHERSLLPEEMNSWKEHIVGCAHCQAILAELEATDSIPLEAAEKEEVLVMQPAAMAAAPADRTAARAEPSEESRVVRMSRRVRWQWLAPAGALAAGLLVWVAWHENQRPNLPSAENKIAKVEPSTPPLPAPRQQSPTSSASDEIAKLSENSEAIRGYALEKKASPPENLKQRDQLNSRAAAPAAKIAAPGLPADKKGGVRQDADRERSELDSLTAANRAQNQPALETKTGAGAAGALAESVEVQTQPANNQVANQLQNQNQANAQKVHGPNPSGQAEQAKKSKSESHAFTSRAGVKAPSAVPRAAANKDVDVSLRLLAGSSDLNLISARGTKTLWRIGPAGFIVFSNDGGATWAPQKSNVSVELTAGSTPSDKVCWIVGRAGTILLTVDSGAHWTILHSPLGEDLAGVRATDALHAAIWSSVSPAAFATADGGVTWNPVPPPQ